MHDANDQFEGDLIEMMDASHNDDGSDMKLERERKVTGEERERKTYKEMNISQYNFLYVSLMLTNANKCLCLAI